MFTFKFPSSWNASSYQGFYYIHTWPLRKGDTQLNPTRFVQNCREYYCKDYRDRIVTSAAAAPSVEKAYSLITMGKPPKKLFEEWASRLNETAANSLYILNSFEKQHKWPLTKFYPVKEEGGHQVPMLFFVGHRKWTMSPYLMSIWSLCLRVGKNHWLPKKLHSLEHGPMVEMLASRPKSAEDGPQLARSVKEWDLFMSLYPKLFGGNTRKHHWAYSHLHNHNDRPEGIQMLMTGSTAYEKLRERWVELKHDHLRRQERNESDQKA